MWRTAQLVGGPESGGLTPDCGRSDGLCAEVLNIAQRRTAVQGERGCGSAQGLRGDMRKHGGSAAWASRRTSANTYAWVRRRISGMVARSGP